MCFLYVLEAVKENGPVLGLVTSVVSSSVSHSALSVEANFFGRRVVPDSCTALLTDCILSLFFGRLGAKAFLSISSARGFWV